MLLEVSVSYKLAEYLRVVSEFEPRSATHQKMLRKTKSSPWARLLPSAKWFERFVIAVVGVPVFLFKQASVGTCVFRIDRERIERTSKTGTLARPWSRVALVHRLSGAYLVELEHGGMPLPYRCFTPEQRSAFELLVPEGKLGLPRRAA